MSTGQRLPTPLASHRSLCRTNNQAALAEPVNDPGPSIRHFARTCARASQEIDLDFGYHRPRVGFGKTQPAMAHVTLQRNGFTLYGRRNWSMKLAMRLYALASFAVVLAVRPRRRLVVTGGFAMASFDHYAKSLARHGVPSVSLVPSLLPIHQRDSFDLTWIDTAPEWLPRRLRRLISPMSALCWLIHNAKVSVSPIGGASVLGWVGLDRLEILLLRWKGIRSICIAVGGDFYRNADIQDPSLRWALQVSYPVDAREHTFVERRLRRWERHADIVLEGALYVDGGSRTDLLSPQPNVVDVRPNSRHERVPEETGSGRKGPIRVIHAPNHRAFKGTEFVTDSIEELRSEGWDIELDLLEGAPHQTVLERMAEADIAIDQLIYAGYGLFGIEAMAAGLPVIANIDSQPFRLLMTRYSFLSECPIVSATPETLTLRLRDLLADREALRSLGQRGHAYARQFHSYESWFALWQVFEDLDFDGARLCKLNQRALYSG